MHSCELVVTPPAQGAALLFELGTLIIEGRCSKVVSKLGLNPRSNQSQQPIANDVTEKDVENSGCSETSRGALPKRTTLMSNNATNVSPTKRNRDLGANEEKDCDVKQRSAEDFNKIITNNGSTENLSVYDLKVRLANPGRLPLRGRAEALWRDHIPLCIEILLAPDCAVCREPFLLLERWTMSVYSQRSHEKSHHITSQWLLNAVRSQLHFSQISAWSAKLKEESLKIQEQQVKNIQNSTSSERQRKFSRETCNFKKYESNCDEDLLKMEAEKRSSEREGSQDTHKLNVVYNLKIAEDTCNLSVFQCQPLKHTFPLTDIGSNVYLEVMLESLPRLEDVPVINCPCQSNINLSRRRKSRDVQENIPQEDMLSKKLAVSCSLVDNSMTKIKGTSSEKEECRDRMKRTSFSPDLEVINSDMGCSSKISRKISIYSSPNTPEFSFHTLKSRESTPEKSDFNDSGFSCSKAEYGKIENQESLHNACLFLLNQNPYHNNSISNVQVPSGKIIDLNYLLVDDRMQTPCRQKGKHRCNCDEESDQGAKDLIKDITNYQAASSNCANHCENSFNLYHNLQNESVSDKFVPHEKREKDVSKHIRRHRKESRRKQILDNGQSVNEKGHCEGPTLSIINVRRNDLSRKTRTCSSSDNSDGRCSPELVHYSSVCDNCHNCVYKHQQKQCQESANKYTTTTSIPILQASKFDHVNRFGNYRNTMSLHGTSIREFYAFKQQNIFSNKCDKIEQPCCICQNKECCSNQCGLENNNLIFNFCSSESCCYPNERVSKRMNGDDDYRPSAKKLISSYTQTDDILCECGRSLVPMCFECSNLTQSSNTSLWRSSKPQNSTPSKLRMKRSKANHNLAAINKSTLFLEAIERTSRMTAKTVGNERIDVNEEGCGPSIESVSKCHDVDINCRLLVDHDKKVIDLNCDNSISKMNNYKCDNNILYSSSFKNYSCKKDSLSHDVTLFSDSDHNKKHKENIGKENSLTKLDLNHEIQKNVADHPAKCFDSTKPVQESPVLNDSENFIKKPKLKRFASAMDKIDKIMFERNERKIKDRCLNERHDFKKYENESKISLKTNNVDANSSIATDSNPSLLTKQLDKENTDYEIDKKDNVVIYEKGDYGVFGETNKNENKQNTNIKQEDVVSIVENKNHTFPSALQPLNVDHSSVPSVTEMDKFRWRLDSAASMVFHSRTGLPLTSSPAPLRRGKSCFDYDSSINSVSGIKSALYGLSSSDHEAADLNPSWSPSSSPGSPNQAQLEAPSFNYTISSKVNTQVIYTNKRNKFRHETSSGLLGSFEESVLNGRLEPAATVAGFTAEIGASGEFCPAHITLPVTVFFYSLGDNTTSSPYLGHINLGRKGYCVPRSGTIQVTLFNPHGTVVKMFVVMYDLSDMPPHSRTFLRQRTLWGGTCLRYLIHLRFLTSKYGKVYLHTDIRIIVSRKADLDTAAAHSLTSLSNIENNSSLSNVKKNRTCCVETGTFERKSRKDKFIFEKKKFNHSDESYKPKDVRENSQSCDTDINKRTSLMSSILSKELSYELRSYTYGPDNPKYSPR